MTRLLTAITATLLMQGYFANATKAETASPLDRPIEDIKRDIASIVHCKWWVVSPSIHHCEDRDEKRGDWIGINLTPDGKINYLHFSPLIVEPVGVNRDRTAAIYGETRRSKETQAATIAAIQELWPTWKAGPAWIKTAFKNARKKNFQDCTRFEGISVYLSEVGPVDSDDRFAFIGLTKKTDLTELNQYGHDPSDEDEDANKCSDLSGN